MITLINPNLIVLKNDFFTTGIVYMPFGLAQFAAVLQKKNIDLNVIDAYGESPYTIKEKDGFLFVGLSTEKIIKKIPEKTKIVILYAINMTSHISLMEIARELKKIHTDIIIVAMENTQAVTAYSLSKIQKDLYKEGIDYILTGEPEERGVAFILSLLKKRSVKKIDGIGLKKNKKIYYKPPKKMITDLDKLPFPAWELFPFEKYWKLKYAHGPFQTKKYLPLLTSRGCPFNCTFCVIPDINNRKWRSHSANYVVDAMEYYINKLGVNEFHIEDVNPTVSDDRIKQICREITRRKLNVIWKFASGTKLETIKNKETIDLLDTAGCNYISFSPESGSDSVLKSINKPFNRTHAYNMLNVIKKTRIKTQACFVIGFPLESDQDRVKTFKLMKQLTKAGIDEIAVFIITPVPGSKLFETMHKKIKNYSQLNFSPIWRKDYKMLNRFRLKMYISFILLKLIFYPVKIFRQIINFLIRRFYTKMEMIPYRVLVTKLFLCKRCKHVQL